MTNQHLIDAALKIGILGPNAPEVPRASCPGCGQVYSDQDRREHTMSYFCPHCRTHTADGNVFPTYEWQRGIQRRMYDRVRGEVS